MTTRSFEKSIFQETYILSNFMARTPSDFLLLRELDTSHTTKYILPARDLRTFTLIERKACGEKKNSSFEKTKFVKYLITIYSSGHESK